MEQVGGGGFGLTLQKKEGPVDAPPEKEGAEETKQNTMWLSSQNQ
jgi:hypothetical protein